MNADIFFPALATVMVLLLLFNLFYGLNDLDKKIQGDDDGKTEKE